MIEIVTGDCVEVLKCFPDACIDSVVTDPPYGLSKEPDAAEVLRHWLAGDDYTHTGAGFMGKKWDSFVPGPTVWREVFRVLKPGGHVLSFSGTRTYDLMVIAMRLAGFEIRDQLAWMYGTGFPKSLNVSKAIDKAAGAERDGATKTVAADKWTAGGRAALERGESSYRVPDGAPATPEAQQWDGWGTALKPAQEPIVLARKPFGGTVAANVLAHGTGALNIDASRIGSEGGTTRGDGVGYAGTSFDCGNFGVEKIDGGRWPANVLLDEAAAAALDEQSPACARFFYCAKPSKAERERGLEHFAETAPTEVTGRDPDSAGQAHARAGMTGKRGRKNTHPTVKPQNLMRYLVRLITPPNGIVLDPYTGSGTTGIAAKLEGFRFVGAELSEEYTAIAYARIGAAQP